MSASDWISSLTSLPRRIIGSLGPTKRDLEQSNDFTYRSPASEQNLIRDICGYVLEAVGLPAGYAGDSIRGRLDGVDAAEVIIDERLDALEESVGEDSGRYVFRDAFDHAYGGILDPSAWVTPAGNYTAPLTATTLRGGAVFGLDAATLIRRTNKLWHTIQQPSARYRVRHGADPASRTWVRYTDAGSPVSFFGVAFDPTKETHNIYGWIAAGGGTTNDVNLGAWVVGTEYLIRFEVRADGHMWASVDAGAYVDCGAVPTSLTCTLEMETAAGATGDMVVRMFEQGADWSHDPPPS